MRLKKGPEAILVLIVSVFGKQYMVGAVRICWQLDQMGRASTTSSQFPSSQPAAKLQNEARVPSSHPVPPLEGWTGFLAGSFNE